MSGSNGYYSVSEAAALLNVSHSTVRHWIKTGKLPAQRIGPKTIRIKPEDLASMLQPVPPHDNGSRADGKEGVQSHQNTSRDHAFLAGGEMGERIRTFDWAKTGLGPIPQWPQSLRTAVNIVLQSPVPLVILWGLDGVMICNDSYAVFAGGRHPFLLGSKVVEGWPEVADFNRHVMEQGLSGKTLSYKDQQLTLFRNNVPEEVWMDLNYSPIMDESGKPAGVLAIVVETTQRVLAEQKQRQAEEALQVEKQHLHSLFMQAPAPVVLLRGPQHHVELANPYALRVWGRKAEAVMNKPLLEALPELEGQGIAELLDDVFTTGKPHYANERLVRLDYGDGKLEEVYFTFVYEPMRNATGEIEGVMVIAFTVTDQVLARKKVEESEERYRTLFASAPMAIFVCDRNAVIQHYNRRAVELWGREPVCGVERHCGSMKLWLPNGTLLPHTQSPIVEVLRTGIPVQNVEVVIERPDGSRIPVLVNFAALMDAQGEITGAITSFIDITERKQLERQKEVFLGIASHELRTPLTTIKAYAQILDRQGHASKQTSRLLEQVVRMERLISELLDPRGCSKAD